MQAGIKWLREREGKEFDSSGLAFPASFKYIPLFTNDSHASQINDYAGHPCKVLSTIGETCEKLGRFRLGLLPPSQIRPAHLRFCPFLRTASRPPAECEQMSRCGSIESPCPMCSVNENYVQ